LKQPQTFAIGGRFYPGTGRDVTGLVQAPQLVFWNVSKVN
jgi:hypothetical protein